MIRAPLNAQPRSSLVAGRCSAADAEILFEIREKKLFRAIEETWEDFCVKRLFFTRSYVDRMIRQYKELGPNFCKLSSFTRIKPFEYRLIAGSVTEDGLCYGGEVIAIEAENAAQLSEAVDALRRDAIPEPDPAQVAELAFARAGKSIRSAVAEWQRLRAMELNDEGRLKLAIEIESCRRQLDRLHELTSV